MHIVFLTVDFNRRTAGGIATYLDTVAAGLTARGHRATIVTTTIPQGDPPPYFVVGLGVAVDRDRRRFDLARHFRDAIVSIHTQHPIDIVEATDYGLEALVCAVDPQIEELGITVLLRVHTPDSMVCEFNDEIRFADSATVHKSEGGYFASVRHFSSPSQAMAKQLTERWGVPAAKVTVLPNPVGPITPPRARSLQGSGPDLGVLTFFGRLERRKGAHVFADALTLMLGDLPELSVTFAGADTRTKTGSVGSRLREQLQPWQDQITFEGFMGGDRRFNALHSADVVCTPSLWENFPYACLEALSLGIPVIATIGSGFEEIMRHGIDGLLVPPGDAHALARAITDVVTRQVRFDRDHIGRQVENFDVARVLPTFERYYGGLAA
ncbi:MAG TPA: glycosyltransferase family 4 protein [Acidimicrobiales bacterium]|jgi:glycosyltransferase involved in cell wall biosynthesis|nr:glycosyltransferase family 4 protein [Acidimicrobiales bacterium]